jgi:hypothetical protein
MSTTDVLTLLQTIFGGVGLLIDKRILDVFRQSVRVGEEDEWKDRLRKVIDEVNLEFANTIAQSG